MKKKKWRYLIALGILVIGLILTACTYFATDIYAKDDVALITDTHIHLSLLPKSIVPNREFLFILEKVTWL